MGGVSVILLKFVLLLAVTKIPALYSATTFSARNVGIIAEHFLINITNGSEKLDWDDGDNHDSEEEEEEDLPGGVVIVIMLVCAIFACSVCCCLCWLCFFCFGRKFKIYDGRIFGSKRIPRPAPSSSGDFNNRDVQMRDFGPNFPTNVSSGVRFHQTSQIGISPYFVEDSPPTYDEIFPSSQKSTFEQVKDHHEDKT